LEKLSPTQFKRNLCPNLIEGLIITSFFQS
jgi:hypothetical protein